MSNFAKVYETEQYGQILALMQNNDDGDPEIRFFAKPPGLGVSSIALSFGDSNDDESWDRQEKAWELVNEEAATGAVKSMFDMLAETGLNFEDDEE